MGRILADENRVRTWFLKLHRWAGLALGVWFLLLGATGVVLGHPEWRWVWHRTVPETWLSPHLGRLLRGTVMRYVEIDAAQPTRLVGGSERGMWRSEDAGVTWQPVTFDGEARAPQVLALVGSPRGTLDGIWIATDDGLWRTTADGRRAERIALRGRYLNSVAPGSGPNELVAVADRSELLRIDLAAPTQPIATALDRVTVTGLPNTVDLFGFIFDLHFGEALLQRAAALRVNDLAGVALIVLPISGFVYWLLPRRWRKRRTDADGNRARRSTMNWLYRAHAPILGLLVVLPLLLLGITGALLTQVEWLDSWAKKIELSRTSLLWTYRFEDLSTEVRQVVTYPNEPQRVSIATRLGVLHSVDGGRVWQRDAALPASAFNLFREGDTVFASLRSGQHWYRIDSAAGWAAFSGPSTAATSAVRLGDAWVVKNSRGFWRGDLAAPLTLSEYQIPTLTGATAFLFLVDLHVGYFFSEHFKWINVLAGLLAVLLAVSGPVLWWRAKWR